MRKVLLWTAVLAGLFYISAALTGMLANPRYDLAKDYPSELGAAGAASADLVNYFGMAPYGALIIFFALKAAGLVPMNRLTLAGFICLGLYGLGFLVGAFYTCDRGCDLGRAGAAAITHSVAIGIAYFCLAVGLVFIGVNARHWQDRAGFAKATLAAAAIIIFLLQLLHGNFPYPGLLLRGVDLLAMLWMLGFAFQLEKESP